MSISVCMGVCMPIFMSACSSVAQYLLFPHEPICDKRTRTAIRTYTHRKTLKPRYVSIQYVMLCRIHTWFLLLRHYLHLHHRLPSLPFISSSPSSSSPSCSSSLSSSFSSSSPFYSSPPSSLPWSSSIRSSHCAGQTTETTWRRDMLVWYRWMEAETVE